MGEKRSYNEETHFSHTSSAKANQCNKKDPEIYDVSFKRVLDMTSPGIKIYRDLNNQML